MRWQRWFLTGAAAYNAAWVVALLVRPEAVFARVPPLLPLLVVGVALEGLGLLLAALRFLRPLLALVLLGKALGPFVFLAFALAGWFEPSSWWLSLVNDVAWIPPLVAILRGKERW